MSLPHAHGALFTLVELIRAHGALLALMELYSRSWNFIHSFTLVELYSYSWSRLAPPHEVSFTFMQLCFHS